MLLLMMRGGTGVASGFKALARRACCCSEKLLVNVGGRHGALQRSLRWPDGSRVFRQQLTRFFNDAALEGRVPVVFDRIVGTAVQPLGDIDPLVTQLTVGLQQHKLLLRSPRCLGDVGIQLVVPPLPALLPRATDYLVGNNSPASHTHVNNGIQKVCVLL